MSAKSYSVSEAARRAGVRVQTIYNRVKAGDFRWVEGSQPRRVHAAEVDDLRRENLAKFDNVYDTTAGEPPSVDEATYLRERAAASERLLRDLEASHQAITDGIEMIRRGERVLRDSVVLTIPDDLDH